MIRVNLVLSGGGARGIAHLGIIKALQEAGVHFNRISGVSMGGISGALIAKGYKPDQALEFFRETNIPRLLRPGFYDGIFKMEKFGEVLKTYFPENSFDSLKIPLIISASDLEGGSTVYFSSGPLIEPLLASSALPIIFRPVSVNGKYLVDGGLINNLPLEPFLDEDLAIIGCHVNPWPRSGNPRSTLQIIERSIQLAIYGTVRTRMGQCHLFIEPPRLEKFAMYDFEKADEIFQTGYRYTIENMDNLLATGFRCER